MVLGQQETIHITKSLSVEYHQTVHVFDMDGTILDSLPLWENPIKRWILNNRSNDIVLNIEKLCLFARIKLSDLIDECCNNYVELSITNMIELLYSRIYKNGNMTVQVRKNIEIFLQALQHNVFYDLQESYKDLDIDLVAIQYISYCKYVLKHKVVLATLNNKNNLDVVIDKNKPMFEPAGGVFDMVLHRELFANSAHMFDKNTFISYISDKFDTPLEAIILYDDTQSVLDSLPPNVGRFKVTSLKNDWCYLLNVIPAIYSTILAKTVNKNVYSSKFLGALTVGNVSNNGNHVPTKMGDNLVLVKYDKFPKISVFYPSGSDYLLEG